MSGSTGEKLDAILIYLQKQGAALQMISGRLDTIDAEMKLVGDSQRRISMRQADLEAHYAEQAGSCAGMMKRMEVRITKLEQQMTPIPVPYDPDDFNS